MSKKTIVALLLACLTSLCLSSVALSYTKIDCIAAAYTGENFTGVSWEIYKAGEYDLGWLIDEDVVTPRMVFGLPNDSISSIRVRPGYKVTIYQHGELLGDTMVMEGDTPSLGDQWVRQASSLAVCLIEDEDIIEKWQASIEADSDLNELLPLSDKLSREEIAEVLDRHDEHFLDVLNVNESDWYGDTTDSDRVNMARYLLILFDELGYDISSWSDGDFAQQINNFYDWRKDLNLWYTACLAMNVNAVAYERIYNALQE